MNQPRYKLSFFITLLIYTGLIALYIYLHQTKVIVSKPKTHAIELALQTFVPPPQIPEEPQFDNFLEKPKLQEHHLEEPKIVQSFVPVGVPVIKTKPPVTPKPIHKKKRKKKKHHKKRRKVVQKVLPPQEIVTPVSTTPPVETAPTALHAKQQRSSPAAKAKFLNHLRKKIDQGKSYPHIAKKRGMQGVVHVSFTISKTGALQNLQIEGPRVFRTSAQNAVLNAFPVDISSVTEELPLNIRLKLHYQIH